MAPDDHRGLLLAEAIRRLEELGRFLGVMKVVRFADLLREHAAACLSIVAKGLAQLA